MRQQNAVEKPLQNSVQGQLNKDSGLDVVQEVCRVLRLEAESILECAGRIESADSGIRRAISLMQSSLESGGKVVVSGLGKSGKIAQKLVATFCSTGTLAVYLHPTEALHGDLGVLRAGDVVLAISHTGNTDELIRILPSLKSLRIPLIGIGGNPRSKLAENSEVWIDGSVPSEACPYNLAPTTSTTVALAIGDALAITLMQLRNFRPESFAQNHPGGGLGKRLNLTVAELMHVGDQVPRVPLTAQIEEVVVIATEKKMGGVLVVDGDQLVGIITDGDIRRSLRHREKFFELKAQDVMTAQPIVADPEMKAQTALELMENRPSQISVLPVVREGTWVGLLRLHDLLRSI